MDYKKLYTHLFNALTDAIEEVHNQNFGAAKRILIRAQQETEEMYMDAEDDEDDSEYSYNKMHKRVIQKTFPSCAFVRYSVKVKRKR